MKNFIILSIILLSVACAKTNLIPKPLPLPVKTSSCPEMYYQRSMPYFNLYKGTKNTGSLIDPSYIFPDKYSYSQPCINPLNEFEFCFLKRENGLQSSANMDLLKYNFCTGQTLFLASHVTMMPDWGVNDWILFTGQNRNVWKIKSNGDSLIDLGVHGYRCQWNPSGTKFILNGNQIFDDNGNLLNTLNIISTSETWLNDTELIYNVSNDPMDSFILKKINTQNGIQYDLFSETKNGTSSICRFNRKSLNLYYSYGESYLKKYRSVNLVTGLKNTLGIYEQSFIQLFYTDIADNKTLIQQTLIDTMTGDITRVNYRSHISIMNRDGSDERQIMIPE